MQLLMNSLELSNVLREKGHIIHFISCVQELLLLLEVSIALIIFSFFVTYFVFSLCISFVVLRVFYQGGTVAETT